MSKVRFLIYISLHDMTGQCTTGVSVSVSVSGGVNKTIKYVLTQTNKQTNIVKTTTYHPPLEIPQKSICIT